LVTPDVFRLLFTDEGVLVELLPCLRPELSVFRDALVSEEKSIIAEFTCVELGKELDIGNLDIFAAKGLRSCKSIDFVDGSVFGYALKLLVPLDQTSAAISILRILLLTWESDRANEVQPIRNFNFVFSRTVMVASGNIRDSCSERSLIGFDHLLQHSLDFALVVNWVERFNNI